MDCRHSDWHSWECVESSQEFDFHCHDRPAVLSRIFRPNRAARYAKYVLIECTSKAAMSIYHSISTGRTFSGRSIGYTVTAGRVETKQLRTNSFVLEACGSTSIPTTLGVKSQQFTRQRTSQCLIFMWSIVQAAGSVTTKSDNFIQLKYVNSNFFH